MDPLELPPNVTILSRSMVAPYDARPRPAFPQPSPGLLLVGALILAGQAALEAIAGGIRRLLRRAARTDA